MNSYSYELDTTSIGATNLIVFSTVSKILTLDCLIAVHVRLFFSKFLVTCMALLGTVCLLDEKSCFFMYVYLSLHTGALYYERSAI